MKQPDSAKSGEVAFRKKIYHQQIDGELIFENEFDAARNEQVLKERMEKTLRQISNLKESGVNLSPYLEIGAERGHRSLVMENDIGATGIATDISFHALKSCRYFSEKFQKKKLPLRVCCDVNSLPLKSNSIFFIFCYETLHHFPNPTPVLQQILRILSHGGTFFFDEEPFQRKLYFPLYKGQYMYSKKYTEKHRLLRFLDSFFAKSACNELDHGIIENDRISIHTWETGLNIFQEKYVTLQSLDRVKTHLFRPYQSVSYVLNYLLGGTISGICKKGGISEISAKDVNDLLICPDCLAGDEENSLIREGDSLICTVCKKRYPIIEGVVILLPHQLLEQLYPDFYRYVNS